MTNEADPSVRNQFDPFASGELLMHHRYGGAGTPITCGVKHGCITAVVDDVRCRDCLAALQAETATLNAEWERVDPEAVAALRRSAERYQQPRRVTRPKATEGGAGDA